MKRNQVNILLAIGLVLATSVMRIITAELHLPNFTPVAAVGIFGGAVIADKKYAYALPLFSMFVADLYFQLFTSVQGFYGIEQLFVYGGMALATLLGSKMGKVNAPKVIGFSLVGSLVFFLVSNFGSYLKGWNGYDFQGLITTYTVAIPFYKYSYIADLVGSCVLFGTYFLAQRSTVKQLQQA